MAAGGTRLLDDHVPELIDAMETAQDAQTIKHALIRFTDRTGFDRFSFAAIKGTESRMYSNYPNEWQRRYLSNNYFAIDPVVITAKRSMQPFTWSCSQMSRAGAEVTEIIEERRSFGMASGLSIPIKAGFGSTAMLTLVSGRPTEDISIYDPTHAATAVAFLHLNIARLGSNLLHGSELLLSPRELTCLGWASIGKTKADTARMLGISEKTVRFYLEQARQKLGASNITHAVRIATTRHLI